MRKFLALIAMLLLPQFALAQTITYTDISVTLTTTPFNCLPPSSNRKSVAFYNPSMITIAYCYRTSAAPNTPCVPVVGNAGTWLLTAGSLYFWTPGNVPNNGLDCIAASATAVLDVTMGN